MKKNSDRVGFLPCDKCANLGSSVFCAFTKPELSSMSAHKAFSMVKKGRVVFQEGSTPQGIFCIYSGKVKIHKLGDDGKDQIVRLAKNGSVV